MGVICEKYARSGQMMILLSSLIVCSLIATLHILFLDVCRCHRQRMLCVGALVYAIGIAVWPILLQFVTDPALLRSSKFVWIGVAFVPIITGCVLCDLDSEHFFNVTPRSVMQMDTNHLISLSFAIAGLMSSNVSKEFAHTVAPIFTVVIMLCLCFVVPGAVVPKGDYSCVLYVLQKVVIFYCIGLILVGMSLSLQATMQRVSTQSLAYFSAVNVAK